MKKISKIYVWIVRRVPTSLLHVLVTFLATIFINVWFAIGLSLGRESLRLGQLDQSAIRKDTFRDLVCDAIGIILGIIIKLVM